MAQATTEGAGRRKPALTDLSVGGFALLADMPGARSFTPGQVRRWVLQRGARDFDAMTDLGKGLRTALSEHWSVRGGTLLRRHESIDGTVGLVTRLHDGEIIESVVIPEAERRTLCLSSQVGCAVGCVFCASGIGGMVRNLSAGEIVEQVLTARDESGDEPITNFVFMGSGEPTHNLSAVVSAIETMNSPDGLGIGARRITVSTVGHPASVRRLAQVPIPFNLALSVHAPTDAAREQLMPGLGRSDLGETLKAARDRFDASGRRITVEAVVLDGVNDRDEDGHAFADLLTGLPVMVNLIPWNPVDDLDLRAPRAERVEALRSILQQSGVEVTVRRPRGQDVGVACGQLRRRALDPSDEEEEQRR